MKKIIFFLSAIIVLICTNSYGWGISFQNPWTGWQDISPGTKAVKYIISGTPCIFFTNGSNVAISCDWSH